MIIEWNAHMFGSDTEQHPFHPCAAYVPGPGQRSDDPLADYYGACKPKARRTSRSGARPASRIGRGPPWRAL
jgi:hypothetical protein